jgi:transposase InsO family protein
MSRKGNPYDNAFAESFIKTLKVEEVYLNEYETFEDAFRNICNFIENVYNLRGCIQLSITDLRFSSKWRLP